jgi:hypothetical protein
MPGRHLIHLSSVLLLGVIAAGCSSITGPDSAMSPGDPAARSARYRVQFESRWTSTTHPIDFPANAHFSPLVGGNHDASAVFWREGQLASPGIRAMAEMGRVTPLDTEVAAQIAAGTAESVFTGPALDESPGSVTMEVTASQRYPLLTLVSMVAPSPDWFVGVSGLPLFQDGRWVAERRVDLDAWDAGTDSGQSFNSADLVSVPFLPVSRILTAPLAPGGRTTPLGSFVFTRIQ